MKIGHDMRSIWCPSANTVYSKKAILLADLPRAARRVCDGSGVVAKLDAVAKRNASDFVTMKRA